MPLRKPHLYSSPWKNCDELRLTSWFPAAKAFSC